MAEVGVGGGPNTFVPTFSPATGQLQIEFTRSVNQFPITRYAQIVPVTAMKGYYLKIDEEETARMVNTQDAQWPLGEDRPTGINSDFEFIAYQTQRFQNSFSIPQETARQSAWDIVASHARIQAAKMMTHRAYRAASTLTTTANYTLNSNYFPKSITLAGSAGYIGAAADSDPVQKIVRAAMEQIIKNTVGVVTPKDIIMVMNPTTARKIASDPGVREYVKNTPHALSALQGDATFSTYGLPQTLFGLGGVVVDDTVSVTTRKGGANTRGFFYGGDTPGVVFVSRPNGLIGNEGPSFSSLTVFAYEDMTVETLEDPWNRRIKGSVVDNSAIELTAPLASLYIADISAAS